MASPAAPLYRILNGTPFVYYLYKENGVFCASSKTEYEYIFTRDDLVDIENEYYVFKITNIFYYFKLKDVHVL